ncbi:hypothetical protein [Acinetobacter radioresistens]|uniref:hypothetical protein n=1 Tax=Acinetobacter radioresistens TaxID=40216 RepID=UPI0020043E43|nr:hypothetical protein [Acinetobacter radioresistens]MCK4100850.1 hypothetical protein [Acinetobacter radioresistens]
MVSVKISELTRELKALNYSNQVLSNHFPNIKNFSDKHWNLGNSNYYFKNDNLEQAIKDKLKLSLNQTITTNDFGELVNLTSFNHFLDGFNYFKSFLKSLLNNDFKISTHLLYYSELRWLNSLLTSQGFINFDRSYLISTSTGYKDLTPLIKKAGSSHDRAWTLFQAWADLSQSDDLLNKTFLFNGFSYKQWLNAGDAPFSSKLLIGWLTELHNQELPYQHDKSLRNNFSYRAHQDFSIFETPDLKKSIDFLLNDLNQIFSLDENSSFFEYLDREIFFTSIQAQFPNMLREHRAKAIDKLIKKACKSFSMDESYAEALASQIISSSNLSVRLKSLATSEDLNSIKFMFYRAILLMRLACSSLKINLRDSGKKDSDIQEWLKIKLNNSPWIREEPEDSLVDYSCELEDFSSKHKETLKNPPKTLWELPADIYSDLLKFTDLDVAAVWSFN